MADVTFKGKPVNLIGKEVKVGDKAPDFNCVNGALAPVTLASSAGKTRLISVVPSLDTPVCSQQTKKFNEAASKINNATIITISVDLPFAQKRFCEAEKVGNVQILSDYQTRSFGEAYGCLIEGLALLTRAIFVIGPDDVVKYVEYVGEVTEHPDYDKALAAAKS